MRLSSELFRTGAIGCGKDGQPFEPKAGRGGFV
jgi:hypothetical protein